MSLQSFPADLASDEATSPIAAILNSIDSAVIIDDMQEVQDYFKTLRADGVKSFLEAWNEEPAILDEVLARIETLWLNPMSVRLFRANSHDELCASLPQAYAVHPHPFVDFLEAVFQGRKFFQAEYEQPLASGELVSLCVTSHMTTFRDRLASICTFTDTNWYSDQRQIADSEERYVKALKGTELGVWELDLRTHEFLLDSEYQSLVGMERTLDAVHSDALMALVHPNDRERLAYSPSNGEYDREFRIQRTDGATIWVHEKGAVTEWTSQENPKRAAGTLRDITIAKREQALHEVENQTLEASMDGIDEATMLTILAHGIERAFLNHACCLKLFHQDQISIAIGGPRFPTDSTDSLVGAAAARPSPCKDSIRDRRFVYVGSLSQHPAYSEFATELSSIGFRSAGCMPILTRDDAVLGTISLFSSAVDQPLPNGLESLNRVAQVAALVIQQRRQAEFRKLSEQQAQNRHRFESLGRLAGGVAHDFNNLLTAIVINAQLCEVKPSDAGAVVESAQRIQQAADVAASLCRQMLTYAGKVEATHKAINLRELASSIAELVRSSINPRVTVHVNETKEAPTIIGAEGAVSQVILNLLTNAFESIDGPG
ncbi:MAG: PAS domain-containing protein, partial [Rubripirellula sp.]